MSTTVKDLSNLRLADSLGRNIDWLEGRVEEERARLAQAQSDGDSFVARSAEMDLTRLVRLLNDACVAFVSIYARKEV